MQTIDNTKPVMVTGATGYVAGRLIEKLLSEGITVHAAVRNPDNKEKTKYLDALAEKLPGSIKYFKSDLLVDGSYDEAMAGCEVVYHTASPFINKVEDAQRDLIDPALKGTQNVLEGVNRTDSVKRVVVTSSCVSIYGDAKDTLNYPNQEMTEDQWNTTSTADHQPYSYSKVIAEKEAWKIAEAQDRWRLVVVNPSFVIGPGINPHATSESFNIMKQFAKGDFKMGAPAFNMGCVDVRDLAVAHYEAGTREDAEGRHIASGHNSSFREIGRIIKDKYPNYPIGKGSVPKFMIWLMAPSAGITRKVVARNVGYPWKANNTKSKEKLGMTYRPLNESVEEFFGSLIDAGVIEKK